MRARPLLIELTTASIYVTVTTDMIVEDLKKIQLKAGLSNQGFAKKLGIHRVSWQRIKNRRVPVSDKFLVRVHKAFPELGVFLSKDVSDVHNKVVDITTKRHQTHYKPSEGGLLRELIAKVKRLFHTDISIGDKR